MDCANWIAATRLAFIQYRLRTGAEKLTRETAAEIDALQKLAYPRRPRKLRKRLTHELRFADERTG